MKTFSTFQLPLAPLPAGRLENCAEPPPPAPDGFVDDDVIASIISRPLAARIHSSPNDLVLSSDENDFAGWSIRGASPFRVIAEKQDLATARPLPSFEEPGLGEPHRGSHRWWIAAAASAASALILSLLFVNLAGRTPVQGKVASVSKSPFHALQSAVASLRP